MSSWRCRSCGKRQCLQYAEARPVSCIDAHENFNLPNWEWVGTEEYGEPITDAELDVKDAFETQVSDILEQIKSMLITKNRKYGNAALDPVRVFAKSDSLEKIRMRIDDKLNRVKNRQNDEDEDVINDLIGYLVLYKIKQQESKQ